jgi:hypothetical protein
MELFIIDLECLNSVTDVLTNVIYWKEGRNSNLNHKWYVRYHWRNWKRTSLWPTYNLELIFMNSDILQNKKLLDNIFDWWTSSLIPQLAVFISYWRGIIQYVTLPILTVAVPCLVLVKDDLFSAWMLIFKKVCFESNEISSRNGLTTLTVKAVQFLLLA